MSFQPQNRGLLTYPEVFWNQRLYCMSFLLSLVLLPWFPACWASPDFYCSGFPLCSAYTWCTFSELDFSYAWLPPRWGPAEVLQSCYIQVTAQHMLGECVISSVLSCCGKDLKRWSSDTAQTFIQQTNDSTLLRHEDVPTSKQRHQPILAPSFYMFCLLLLNQPYAN